MDFAFSGGVKPGGLTSPTEIRILLCYLLQTVDAPLSKEEIESALLEEELVNYFEYANALGTLVESEHIVQEENLYTVTEKGKEAAQNLATSLPLSVKEKAVNSAIYAMQFSKKIRQNQAQVKELTNGSFSVQCSISDIQGPVFSFEIIMPDKLTANQVKTSFIENGETFFKIMLSAVTRNTEPIEDALAALMVDE